jgi:hypothetical protein
VNEWVFLTGHKGKERKKIERLAKQQSTEHLAFLVDAEDEVDVGNGVDEMEVLLVPLRAIVRFWNYNNNNTK